MCYAKDDIPWWPHFPWHYFVVVTSIKGGSVKLPFPTVEASKVKDIVNGVALW
jgi:hypothetical protein